MMELKTKINMFFCEFLLAVFLSTAVSLLSVLFYVVYIVAGILPAMITAIAVFGLVYISPKDSSP